MSKPARKARTPRGIKATKDSKFKPLRAGCTVLNWSNAMENTIEYVEAKTGREYYGSIHKRSREML
jgi:hypothetical protein